jgi:hypothetical protein
VLRPAAKEAHRLGDLAQIGRDCGLQVVDLAPAPRLFARSRKPAQAEEDVDRGYEGALGEGGLGGRHDAPLKSLVVLGRHRADEPCTLQAADLDPSDRLARMAL